ncbi:MAG: hypothetical protein ACFFC7_32125, partial [Candidatus Hermodarchaeota archaeon]
IVLQKQKSLVYTRPKINDICKNYAGLRAYIDKVKSACRKKDILTASYAANELQIWIAEEMAKFEGEIFANLYSRFNLYEEIKTIYNQLSLPNLDKYVASGDFEGLELAVNQLEFIIQRYCQDQRTDLLIFKDFKTLERYFEEK